METKMKISTEQLFVLYRDIRRLFPNTTIDDFSEIIDQDGYWDTRQRTNIQTESFTALKKMWFGKGVSHIKKLWNLFTTNQFQDIVDKDLIRLSRLFRSNK
jgi:hypothetical protein